MFYISAGLFLVCMGVIAYYKPKIKEIEEENSFQVAVDNLMDVFIRQNEYRDIAFAIVTSGEAFWKFFSKWTVKELGTRFSPFSFPRDTFLTAFNKYSDKLVNREIDHDPSLHLDERHKKVLLEWKEMRKYYAIADRFAPLVGGFVIGSLISRLITSFVG